MFKRLISLSLLCFAIDAHASITVNTAADTSGTSACSLRDAVAVVNSGTLTKSVGGCTDTDSTTTIVLAAQTIYTLNSELTISSSVTFQSSDINDTNDPVGANNPSIEAVGNHRIFNIVPPTSNGTTPIVSITSVDLNGCGNNGGSTICETNGGVIYNQGSLTLTSMRIYNGIATSGGAIYNDQTGTLAATTVEIKDNTAQQGAAVYSVLPSYSFNRSLIRDNNIANGTAPSFAIYTQTVNPTLSSASNGVINTTVYHNSAYALNIVPGTVVNNDTIVGNLQGGVVLDASTGAVLANSIVAGNNGADCSFVSGDATPINNIIYTNGCGSTAGTITSSTQLTDQTLIATDSTSGSDVCALPPTPGLLCPFSSAYSGQFTGYLLPRLVPAIGATLADSPIVNKGNTSNTAGEGCSSVDQRNDPRTLCDIGAIELVIPNGNSQTNGEDIFYGDIASIDLTPVTGDGQLIPASLCATLYGTPPASQGGTWQDGCIIYSTAPIKGTASFDALTNTLTYTPSSDWHGFDKFTYNMFTTTSFFSEAQNDQNINVTTTIVQSPPTGITSKTVGAGGVGIFAVFALMGLAVRRRLTGGQS